MMKKGLFCVILVLFVGMSIEASAGSLLITRVLTTEQIQNFTLENNNSPPDAPDIAGPMLVKAGKSYEWSFKAIDPDGDDIYYYIDWGDGNYEEWLGLFGSGEEVLVSHTYPKYGEALIRARAKDIHGAIGEWGTIPIKIPQSTLQTFSIPGSQKVMNVVPSTENIDEAKSRVRVYNGSLSGYVTDTNMNPIEGARVRVHFHGTYEENYSDSTGYYHVTNIPICYCLKNTTCSKEGYITEWVLLSITENTTHDFILIANRPPDAPEVTGPYFTKPGVPYKCKIKTNDPDGDDVSYQIDWDDGDISEWTDFYESGEEIKRKHNYSWKGTFLIKARAKDIHGAIGEWGYITFEVPKNTQQPSNSLILQILQRLANIR